MASFDPTKPIDDPTVWYPKGMYIEDTSNDDDGPAFLLAEKDMAALNRYVWSCKLLPTTRDEYKLSLGIIDGSEISQPVWSAADNVLVTYKGMKTDGTGFLDNTWPSIVDISNNIYNYSTQAGGKEDTSYYANMLRWVGDYNREIVKPPSDQDQNKINELKESIKALTKMQIDSVDELQEKAEAAKTALKDFHDVSKNHQSKLQGSTQTMKNLLDGEDGEIAQLTQEIDQCLSDIEGYEQEIDADRLKIKQTLYYAWIPIAGTIAGPLVSLSARADIRVLEEAISKLNNTINQDRDKLRSAIRLKGDITSMDKQVVQLVGCVVPAIITLEKLQGAWGVMASDLQNLHDLFDKQDGESIPPMLLEKLELEKIVEQWNILAEYADNYRQIAYLSSEPPRESVDEFLKELQEVQKK